VRARLAELFPIVLAVVVPLAGLVLALQHAAQGDRRQALRVGAATLLGGCLYALLVTR
jgi:threonine/homoserine/homoserine lactone efflux protein